MCGHEEEGAGVPKVWPNVWAMSKRLHELQIAFAHAGGRGVDLAEEIDRLQDELISLEIGTCDTCGEPYDVASRDGRCGDCGECAQHCTHERLLVE